MSMSGSLGAVNAFMILFGVMVAMLLGLVVPEKDTEAERTSEYWRLMFGLPIAIVLVLSGVAGAGGWVLGGVLAPQVAASQQVRVPAMALGDLVSLDSC